MNEIFIFIGGALIGGFIVWRFFLSNNQRRIEKSFEEWSKLAEKYEDTKRID